MDIQTLSKNLVVFLGPFLPVFIAAGNEAIETIGGKVGETGWQQAQSIWGKLFPKIKKHPSALEAVKDFTTSPTDEDTLASLRLQLKKLLEKDEELAFEIDQLLQGEVIQKVIAEHGSRVENISQSLNRSGQQEVSASDNSSITGVKQQG